MCGADEANVSQSLATLLKFRTKTKEPRAKALRQFKITSACKEPSSPRATVRRSAHWIAKPEVSPVDHDQDVGFRSASQNGFG
jgi:hypothetical protein